MKALKSIKLQDVTILIDGETKIAPMKMIYGFFCLLFFSLSLHAQQTIQFSGVAVDTSIQGVSLWYGNSFPDSDFNMIRSHSLKKENNEFKLQITANVPRSVLLSTPGLQSQAVYMTPGDSLSFVVRLEKMYDGRTWPIFHFTGKNEAHYNYVYQKAVALGKEKRYLFNKGDDILEYKQSLAAYREKNKAFLESYRQAYPVSDDFYNHTKDAIDDDYVYALYYPVRYKLVDKRDLPAGYFDPDIRPYSPYRYIYCYTDDLYTHFDTVYNHIIHDAAGKEREFLLSLFIGLFSAKSEPGYHARLTEVIEQAPALVHDTAYLAYIDRAKQHYEKLKLPFPDEVLSGTLLKACGEEGTISLKEMLARYEGKPVYVDFWATWCVPCRDDIARSKETKAYLEEQGIAYVYLAVKDDEGRWRKASEELGIDKNQYFLVDSDNSPLKGHVSYHEIPRYLLINARHGIENLKAPHPTPEHFEDLKRNVEKMVKVPKVYSY